MDSEVWASLLSATKRRLALQPYRADRTVSHDDLEANDDMQIEFTCPFCCGEFDIGSLCSHIEEEHCFEPKAGVCPVCSTKVKNDMVGHITFQHGHLFKMQRRRFGLAVTSVGSALSSIVKERGMAAFQVHSGGNNYWSAANVAHAGTDPLASILFGLPTSEYVEILKPTEASLMDKEPATSRVNSLNVSATSEELTKQWEAASLRSSFSQQLVLSTIFKDL